MSKDNQIQCPICTRFMLDEVMINGEPHYFCVSCTQDDLNYEYNEYKSNVIAFNELIKDWI